MADNAHSMLDDDELFAGVEPFDLIYDSYDTHFYPLVFLEHFFMHLFFPFTYFMSRNPIVNRFDLSIAGIKYSYGYNLMVLLMVVSYCLASSNCGQAIYTPLLFFVTHRGMIALKYATLSPTELTRIYSTTDRDVINTYQDQLQLNTVLPGGIPEVIQFSIASSAAKTGVRLHELAFHISKKIEQQSNEDQILNWKRLAVYKKCRELCPSGDGSFTVSVSGACMGLLTMSKFPTESARPFLDKLLLVLIVIQIIIPFVILLEYGNPKELDVFSIIFYITSTIINYLFYRLVLNFLNISMLSSVDAAVVAANLGEMIRHPAYCLTRNLVTTRLEGQMPPSKESLAEMKTKSKSAEVLTWPRKRTGGAGANNIIASSYSAESNVGGMQLNILHQTAHVDVSKNDSNAASPHDLLSTNWGVFTDAELLALRQEEAVRAKSQSRDSLNNTASQRDTSARLETMRIQGVEPMVPRVSLHCASNVFAWLYTRLILQTLGERLMFRVDVYLGFFTLVAALNMVIIVLSLLLHNAIEGNSHADMLAQSAYFVQMLVLVAVVGGYILFIIRQKSIVNSSFANHKYELMGSLVNEKNKLQAHQRKFDQINSSGTGDDAAQRTACGLELAEQNRTVEALETALNTIDLMNAENPASILGMECTNGVASSFLTTLISFFSYIAAMALHNPSVASSDL